MLCPECGSTESTVTDSRPRGVDKIPYIYRRRRCLDCKYKFTTHEIVKEPSLIKRKVTPLKATEVLAKIRSFLEVELSR